MGTGAGGVDRPKVPNFQGTDPTETSDRYIDNPAVATSPRRRPCGRPAGVVTGLEPGFYRTASSPSASAWGHQGVVKEGPNARAVTCVTLSRAQHPVGRLRPRCRVSMALRTSGST